MVAALKLEHITPEEYLASEIDSPVKREYWAGYIFAMTGGTNAHQLIAGNIYSTLDRLLRDKPCRPINSDTKIRIRNGRDVRFYYPDGGVVCEENPRAEHFQDKPTVIIEVPSPSTRRADEGALHAVERLHRLPPPLGVRDLRLDLRVAGAEQLRAAEVGVDADEGEREQVGERRLADVVLAILFVLELTGARR